MWIRSQNKEMLCDCTLFYTFQGKVRAESATGTNIILGEYESNERAVAILSEMQSRVIALDTINFLGSDSITLHSEKLMTVYEMPEK